MKDPDWQPAPPTKPELLELYVLKHWDGGAGTANRNSGYLVRSQGLAEAWVKYYPGASYDKINGVIIDSLADIEIAEKELKRRRALNKLTNEEKKLLGL